MWFVYALIGALAAGIAAIFNKIGLKTIDSNLAASLRAVVIASAVVLFTFTTGKFSGLSAVNSSAWFWIILSGLAGAVSWIFYFAALKIGSASDVSAIDRFSIIFVVIFAILFLGEKFTWLKLFGAILIGAGAFLITR